MIYIILILIFLTGCKEADKEVGKDEIKEYSNALIDQYGSEEAWNCRAICLDNITRKKGD